MPSMGRCQQLQAPSSGQLWNNVPIAPSASLAWQSGAGAVPARGPTCWHCSCPQICPRELKRWKPDSHPLCSRAQAHCCPGVATAGGNVLANPTGAGSDAASTVQRVCLVPQHQTGVAHVDLD